MPSMEFTTEEATTLFEEGSHKKDIHAMIVDASRNQMFTASKDKTAKVLDLASGEILHTLEGHSYDVNALLLIGNVLYTGADASGAEKEYLKAWDVDSGKLLNTFGGHDGGVWALACAPELELFFSGSDDRTIRVWSTATHEHVGTLAGVHEAKVRSLHYDAGRLYSGGHDGKIAVWDVKTMAQVGSFDGQAGFITAIVADEELIYTASSDKTVFVWDKASGEKKSILNHESWVGALTLHNKTLLAGVGDATVRAWDVANATVLCSLNGHVKCNAVSSLQVADGKLYSAAWDGKINVWHLDDILEKISQSAVVAAESVVKGEAVNAVVNEPAVTSSIFDETDCNLLD